MMSILPLLLPLLLLADRSLQQQQQPGDSLFVVNRRLCHGLCQCTAETIDCNRQDSLSHLPTAFPPQVPEFDKLHVSHANFRHRQLSRRNFTLISHLTSLKIVYSHLVSIEDNTFSQMDRLLYMDLSSNDFRRIEPRAFSGLNLATFYLERNTIPVTLHRDMFTGLRAKKFYLSKNNIKLLPYEPFQHAEIKFLGLFNNSISELDSRFQTLFGQSDSILDLTMNPLHCGCGLVWLPSLVKRWYNLPNYVDIKCSRPARLHDREVRKLRASEFACEAPTIGRISVEVGPGGSLRLGCHASATGESGNAPPRVSWRRLASDKSEAPEELEYLRKFERHSTVTLNVSRAHADNSFVCTAFNEINESNEVQVRLKLADYFIQSPPRPLLPRTSDSPQRQHPSSSGDRDPAGDTNLSKNPNLTSETHFLFKKQFSILQMIGAVVGTFTGVVVLILVVYCVQDHIGKKSSSANPYWTIVPQDPKQQQQQQQQLYHANTLNSHHPHLSRQQQPQYAMIQHQQQQQHALPPNNSILVATTSAAMTNSSHSQEYDIPQFEPEIVNNNSSSHQHFLPKNNYPQPPSHPPPPGTKSYYSDQI